MTDTERTPRTAEGRALRIRELRTAARGIDHSLADVPDYERFDRAIAAIEAAAVSDFAKRLNHVPTMHVVNGQKRPRTAADFRAAVLRLIEEEAHRE